MTIITKRINFYIILVLCVLIVNSFRTLNAEELTIQKSISDTSAIQDYGSFQFKSESYALKTSLCGTVAPLPTVVFAIPGLVFGPSLGYFYAGMPGRAWAGIGIRSVAVLGMFSAFAIAISDFDNYECAYGNCNSKATTVGTLFFSSAGVLVFSAVYDIATLKKNMRKKKASMLQSNFNIEPIYYAETKSVGLSLKLRF